MTPVVVLSGLDVTAFDRIKKEPDSKFAPNGIFLCKPVKRPGYPRNQANLYIEAIRDFILSKKEDEPISVQLIQMDYGDQSSRDFSQSFFPFAIKRTIAPIPYSNFSTNNEKNKYLNDFVTNIQHTCLTVRKIANAVSEMTHVHNLTPLLLPLTNFRSEHYKELLQNLYEEIGSSKEPKSILEEMVKNFFAKHPRATPPDDQRHAFSDGILYFKSPGKHRHGFFRHSSREEHCPSCLPRARSRLGGSYDYAFHYDCEPVKGKLANEYPSCHGQMAEPKPKHINIAPNDFII